MSPSSREREYARRRYEKWQAKQAVRLEKQRRGRRNAVAAAVAVTAVLVITGVTLVLRGGSDDGTNPAEATSSLPPASSSAEPSSSADAANACPTPTVKPPATPQSFSSAPDPQLAEGKTWTLTLTTSCGPIVAKLDGAKAPKAVASAVFLTQKKFWAGSPCHRLTTSGIYVLQCGDPTGSGTGGPGYSFGPVENAPSNGVYPPGTLAMARASSPDSNGSQFFIVYKETTLPGGYTVFGRIQTGLDVVTKVAAGGVSGGTGDGAPVRAVSIVSTTVTSD